MCIYIFYKEIFRLLLLKDEFNANFETVCITNHRTKAMERKTNTKLLITIRSFYRNYLLNIINVVHI